MSRILVIFQSESARLPPGELSEEQVEGFKNAINDFVGSEPSVEWVGFYVNDDGVGFAEWEADDVETIRAWYDDLEGVEPDAIVAVEHVPIL